MGRMDDDEAPAEHAPAGEADPIVPGPLALPRAKARAPQLAKAPAPARVTTDPHYRYINLQQAAGNRRETRPGSMMPVQRQELVPRPPPDSGIRCEEIYDRADYFRYNSGDLAAHLHRERYEVLRMECTPAPEYDFSEYGMHYHLVKDLHHRHTRRDGSHAESMVTQMSKLFTRVTRHVI